MLARNANRRTGDAAARDSCEDLGRSSVPRNSQDNPPAQDDRLSGPDTRRPLFPDSNAWARLRERLAGLKNGCGRTDPIRAELSGSNRCSAAGYTARSYTPVLRLCRMLVNAGYDPATPLHCYRGEILCLIVRSIGEAATLELNGRGTGFVRRRPAVGTAPPVDSAGPDDAEGSP
jgi:hypothetical protein